MNTMQRVRSGLMAMVFGVSMMMAKPVCVKAETVPPALMAPCECGATMTYQGDIEIGWILMGEDFHEYVVDHYYHCRYGHVRCIRTSTATERHTRNQYIDLGHHTYPDELFGEHTYKLMCKCGKEYETVSIICHYPGTNSHNTPF